MTINELKDYYNKKDIYFSPKIEWSKLNEQKFTNLNTANIIPEFPINKKIQYDKEKLIKAIQFGMIIILQYQGEEDESHGGHERTVAPLNLGKNKNTGNILVRSYQLDGYSVKEKKNVQKVWRLFNVDNIITMMFTGDFLRMPPKDYRQNDRIMTEFTICRADFNTIRKNQHKLVQSGKIQSQQDGELTSKDKLNIVEIRNSGSMLDLKNPMSNKIIQNVKESDIKITFVKSLFGKMQFAILGTLGTVNKSVKLYNEKTLLGTFIVVDTIVDGDIRKKKNIRGDAEFDLFLFVKKLN